MREAMSARAIAESELQVWSATIRRAFAPLSEPNPSLADGEAVFPHYCNWCNTKPIRSTCSSCNTSNWKSA
ncbi:hypothetical protein PC129_g7830 [Phytophthora cactorum]|uniref:Uncharacterized protein n=1 Tax=Phytophthora cactorum TaxID=29920 RepID=A0A8T1IAN6_9STRA|nr:hypothetical protein Pcac1_g25491 [Phytophthora cactorum]KAG2910554.1 hypothetical protein PC114_g9733 [Phytophthora cactorum]KAG2919928.1 hypothetical protein PC117_g16664 [Phytophthora cactorum]KAG3018720.1 hypothetical protein PC119_g10568 [Phytophthora cactorum]KAG3022042.1 hypothetical protein PC120_g8343 [Phytophthora cactorum]